MIAPYVDKVKEDLHLPADSKSLLIWDAFKAQSCPNVIDKLESLDIVSVMVPKNMTHLLQPLDLTTNTVFKRLENKAFSDYVTNTITKELHQDSPHDVTTIDVDLKLPTLKHAKLMGEIFSHFKEEKGVEAIMKRLESCGV